MIRGLLPDLSWLSAYRREDLRGDLVAGVTTAVMLIPQGMGYAMLAGLPPIVGLYAATVPLLMYGLFGTSRQLAVGPVAMDSLLVASTVGVIAQSGTEDYVALAALLALMVGALQMAMGALRLGFLVNFLSQPVISGFTSAAALIIGFSQLKHVVGVSLPRTHHVHEALLALAERWREIHLPTLVIGLGSILLLKTLKTHAPRFPRALAIVVLGTVGVWALGLQHNGVTIVGDVPAGLPGFALPSFDAGLLGQLAAGALTIALVSFMEAISVGKHLARVRRENVDANRELIALGFANTGTSLFGGYPVAGGFSRSAVNAQAGANTQLAGWITAALVGATLLFLTPLFHFLPTAVLGAIIMSAVFSLIDLREPMRLWRVKRADFWLLVTTFVATLGIGIQEGILVGVGASVALFMVRTTQPHFAVLGRIPGTDAYLNLERHPQAQTEPGVLVVRVDAQFYFGNVSFLKETLLKLAARASDPVQVLVLDASGMNQLDSSAEAALRDIDAELAERGVHLLLCNVKGPVRDVMQRAGFLQHLGTDRVLLQVQDAVDRARQLIRRQVRPHSLPPASPPAPEARPSVAHPQAALTYHI